VALVFDTSGSMGERDIGKGLREVGGAVKGADKVWLIPTDSTPHKCVQVRSIKRAADELVGGGGTDMGAGLEKAGECKAAVTVVLTDGDTDWPATKPAGNKDVIIVLTRRHRTPSTPAWAAEVIDASKDFERT
jgi:predicted metal-dependent peptidase